jgi:hypothetical protein
MPLDERDSSGAHVSLKEHNMHALSAPQIGVPTAWVLDGF